MCEVESEVSLRVSQPRRRKTASTDKAPPELSFHHNSNKNDEPSDSWQAGLVKESDLPQWMKEANTKDPDEEDVRKLSVGLERSVRPSSFRMSKFCEIPEEVEEDDKEKEEQNGVHSDTLTVDAITGNHLSTSNYELDFRDRTTSAPVVSTNKKPRRVQSQLITVRDRDPDTSYTFDTFDSESLGGTPPRRKAVSVGQREMYETKEDKREGKAWEAAKIDAATYVARKQSKSRKGSIWARLRRTFSKKKKSKTVEESNDLLPPKKVVVKEETKHLLEQMNSCSLMTTAPPPAGRRDRKAPAFEKAEVERELVVQSLKYYRRSDFMDNYGAPK